MSERVGLVLSGGGAKGAYQVGVLQALTELDIPIHAISGASIGTINGAVLASASSLSEGAKRLEKIWLELSSNTSPLSPDYLNLLLATGLNIDKLTALNEKLNSSGIKTPLEDSIFDNSTLKRLLEEYIDYQALKEGIPLYVSAFQNNDTFSDFANLAMTELGLSETRDSDYFLLKSKTKDECQKLLLASAAIPFIFSAQEINGKIYSDGAQGGWSKSQGNTPIQPLIQDAKCDTIIVTHLSDGSLWSRHDFQHKKIIEIRPQSTIKRDKGFMGNVKDSLGFDSSKITSWINQGYQDAHYTLEKIHKVSQTITDLKKSEGSITSITQKNHKAESELDKAMARLKQKKTSRMVLVD